MLTTSTSNYTRVVSRIINLLVTLTNTTRPSNSRMMATVPLTPPTNKLYFREGQLSFEEVRKLAKEYYLILTHNRYGGMCYCIVLELSATGRVNATIENFKKL